ncbi:MAG: molybdenum cofactor biosynthesis protein MoaE [Mogibacterium sp.]|nr:molybdenum cofactor biosynthesis protein MoaE [Mogibacterium sp.]
MSEYLIRSEEVPSADAWLREAKADPSAEHIGMYLTHTGVVRRSAKAKVREAAEGTRPVSGMRFSYDEAKAEAAIAETFTLPGIYYVRVWMNTGQLELGDTIMQVLIGGDIRPHVIDGLQYLVGKLKSECVVEEEQYE